MSYSSKIPQCRALTGHPEPIWQSEYQAPQRHWVVQSLTFKVQIVFLLLATSKEEHHFHILESKQYTEDF